MTNPTAKKFGYPGSLIAEYQHWLVLLRPAQVTLGSLVLVCRDAATAFSDISPAAFSELAKVSKDIETDLMSFNAYQKINYLMLMMVDHDVHFHIIPRYDQPQIFAGNKYIDHGWPAVPDLGQAITPDADDFAGIRDKLKAVWTS